MVVHRGASASRRLKYGMSDFGGQPPHSKVVLWERELPKTFSETEKTPCYVRVYILHIMKQVVESLMAAQFAFRECTKAVLLPVSCLRRALNPLGAYIKLRKFADKSKRREKNFCASRLISRL